MEPSLREPTARSVWVFFSAARGSILVAVLFLRQLNMPTRPDAQPWDRYLFVVLAVLVVWVKSAEMFSRTVAATEVMPSSKATSRGAEGRRVDA